MSILPFVSFILMVMGMCCFIFHKEVITLEKEYLHFRGYMRTERSFRNQLQNELFKKTAPKKVNPNPANPSPPRPSKPRSYVGHREKNVFSDSSKFNLGPLLADPRNTFFPLVRETAAKFLRLLYGHLSLEKEFPNWEYELLDTWIEKHPAPQALSDLFPSNPKLADIFYRLLKGTHTYKLDTKEGIPPLGDFFWISPDKKQRAICFHFASKPLLTTLFGEKPTRCILEEEAKKQGEKKKKLLEAEIRAILLKAPHESLDFEALHPLFNLERTAIRSSVLTASDKDSGISFHQPLPQKIELSIPKTQAPPPKPDPQEHK